MTAVVVPSDSPCVMTFQETDGLLGILGCVVHPCCRARQTRQLAGDRKRVAVNSHKRHSVGVYRISGYEALLRRS